MGDLPLEKISLNVARRRAEEILGRRTALALFPEEVWRMILSDVKSPVDLWNVSHATMQLDDILSKEKGTFFVTKIFPLLLPFLDTQSTFNCHLVCKLWNSTMTTTLLHQKPGQISNDGDTSQESGTPLPLKLSSIDQIQSAMETFLTTWNVPSFIEINLGWDRIDDFFNSVKTLLGQYSPMVYHLRLIGCQRYAPAGFYNYLMEIFVLLPNIKVLEIECLYENTCIGIRLNALKRVIGVSKLPPLKNLDTMRLKFSSVPPDFLNELLKVYGKQLKCLEMKFSEEVELKFLQGLEFPVLEKLGFDANELPVMCDVLRFMEKCKTLNVLSLVLPSIRGEGKSSKVYLNRAFDVLKRRLRFLQVFGERLECLEWFTGILGKKMGTWIRCSRFGYIDEFRSRDVYYLVHSGPGLCK